MIIDKAYFEYVVKCPVCNKTTNFITRIIKDGKTIYMCSKCYEKVRTNDIRFD